MMPQYNTHLKFILIILLFSIAGGCTSLGPTEPNEQYSGPFPLGFNELTDKNPLLAQELAKLPELQDGISEAEETALENIVRLYDVNPDKFDNAFEHMYKVGIPEVRKYCSPLQALFWMAEEGKYAEITRLISNYSLDSLLKQAWDFRPEDITHYKHMYLDISDEQAKQILATLDSKEQNIYAGSDPRLLKKLLWVRYDMSPMHFPRKQRKIIKGSIRVSEKYSKWINPEIVIERLNAPELLDYYINSNIVYDHKIPAYHRPPRSVMKERYGDCDDLAYFGKTVLTKAGYDVFGRVLGDEEILCHIGLGVKLEDGSYLLAVHFNRAGNHMRGPYKTLLELDQALGYGGRYHLRGPFFFPWQYF